ncbi:MAG TPA: EAL domain-containing protein [Steroidobacteraceae bacterium]|nr:EAL domain-containing protein [Steroidobacteraceae bacterium]
MSNNRRILLVQEIAADARAVRDALSNSGPYALNVEWVRRCSEAIGLLTGDAARGAEGFAAVLVDLFLPDSSGLETFARLFKAAPQVPILVLSSSQNEPIARQAVQQGAQDYLLKGRLDSYLLPKALGSMIDRAAHAEALFEEKERAQVTLNSIGDAVMSCDVSTRVTYLNKVAERLTGWTGERASGRPIEEVFHIMDAATRATIPNPMAMAIREDRTVMLAPNSILRRGDGVEAAIEDSVAPIHDRHGRVTGAVMVFHDVSTTRALSLNLAHQAQHDSLTDLPNRLLLDDRLTHAMVAARRHDMKLAVLYLDLDRFKKVNDSLGHNIGDRLLQTIAQRLLGCVRGSDTVSRQGGDEFVILLSELADGQDAAVSAEKVLRTLSVPVDIDGHHLHVSASIGIAIYPEDGDDAVTLLKHADFAMYHAKDCGRSNFQFFREDMNVRALERQSVESGLHQALERNELTLYYQPIVDLWSGAATGIEALVRWRHPHRGLLLPQHFVPIAEECGLILPIGRWVLREACRQNRAWQDAGLSPMRITVNVSAVELRNKNFVEGVRQCLAETGLAAQHLELELTETFLMQDSASTALVLNALKEVGVQLALDDFGTGYSSLSHLKGFPIDTMKIDLAFVSEINTNPNDASIVRAMIGLGRSLNIRVVAEGVETAEQLARLQEQQCPEGQGYFFSRPVIADEIPRLLYAAPPGFPGLHGGPAGESNGTHAIARPSEAPSGLARRFTRN